MERLLGCIKSKLDGTERKFSASKGSLDIPEEFSYKPYMTDIVTQVGNTCVCNSTISVLDWIINVKSGKKTFNGFSPNEIYNIRSNKSSDEGMAFKEALNYVRNHGVKKGDGNIFKIEDYAMIGSEILLKYALVENGPALFAVPVYDTNYTDFWNPRGDIVGGHAMAIVGYNKEGFIIRNSWGNSYGENGYALLNYKDFKQIWEIWTIL